MQVISEQEFSFMDEVETNYIIKENEPENTI